MRSKVGPFDDSGDRVEIRNILPLQPFQLAQEAGPVMLSFLYYVSFLKIPFILRFFLS